MESLPDYGKVMFNHQDPASFEKAFPNATKGELEFLKYILTYDRPKSVKDVNKEVIIIYLAAWSLIFSGIAKGF